MVKRLLTAEDLFDLPDGGRWHELAKGELRETPIPGVLHGVVKARIGWLLMQLLEDRSLSHVVGMSSGVILRRDPDTVRGPDLYLFDGSRISREDVPEGFFEIVPDLVVEVVSFQDLAEDLEERVQDWLDAGVRLLLVVYPRTRSITAFRGPHDIRHYHGDEEFDAGPVLPNFRYPASHLFGPRAAHR